MYYGRLLPLLLPLLLTVAFNGVPIFVMAHDCSRGYVVREGSMQTINTIKITEDVNVIETKPNVYVYPLDEGFQGVSLVAEDGSGRNHTAWFPMSPQPQRDQCSTRVEEWVEMKMGAQIQTKLTSFHLYFWVRYGGCIKACYGSSTVARSLRSLSVVGHDYFVWRDTTPTGASCRVRRLSRSTASAPETCQNLSPQGHVPSSPTTTHHPPQRPASSTSPPLVTPTSSASTPDRGSSVVGWVVGVVVVVAMAVVVTVVVVWQISRRRRSVMPPIMRWRPQADEVQRHSNGSVNSLYEPFDNKRT